jgi:hypothetical protein
MATMKIGYDSNVTSYADADLFSFPNNPKILDSLMASQREIKELPFSKIHYLIDRGGLKAKSIILNGYFHGSSKDTDFETLSKMIYALDATNSGLLRFYMTDTKFIFCFGSSLKKTWTGGRINFTDYVANLITPLPFVYSDTGKYETWTITSTSAVTMNSSNDNGASAGAFDNDGTAPAHILLWTITNNTANTVTKVEIGDAAASGGAVQGNKITWNGSLASGQVLKIYMFKMVNYIFKKLYYTVNDVLSGSRDFDGVEPPFIVAGSQNQDFSVKITGTSPNVTVRADWRDSYWM